MAVSSLGRGAELNWLTDYQAALNKAAAEDKAVIINFTGSDWCGWCMRLKKQVFDTPEFQAFAEANLVLVEADFPKRKALSAEQKQKNQVLAQKFGIEGFPTLIILNSAGKPVAKSGYMEGGPAAFIPALKRAPGINWRAAAAPRAKSAASADAAPADPWAGMPTSVKRYEDLKLTGLSGPASRRLAMVNNQTFAPGETARVKLKDGVVKVLCKEIRERSVIVQVEDAPTALELFLNGR